MDQDRFDAVTMAMAHEHGEGRVSRRVLGGSLAAMATALGLGLGLGIAEQDEAEAKKSCRQKCKKKDSREKRRRCRRRCKNSSGCVNDNDCQSGQRCVNGRCQALVGCSPPNNTQGSCPSGQLCNAQSICVAGCTGGPGQGTCPNGQVCTNGTCQATGALNQMGTGTLTSQSAPDCGAQGSCTDSVTGALTGSPIAAGTFTGLLTGSNYQVTGDPNVFTADVTGTVTAVETSTGDTYTTQVTSVLTQNMTTGAFSNEGTFTITGGTGRFAGATGNGTLLSAGTDGGQAGTLDSLQLSGSINLP